MKNKKTVTSIDRMILNSLCFCCIFHCFSFQRRILFRFYVFFQLQLRKITHSKQKKSLFFNRQSQLYFQSRINGAEGLDVQISDRWPLTNSLELFAFCSAWLVLFHLPLISLNLSNFFTQNYEDRCVAAHTFLPSMWSNHDGIHLNRSITLWWQHRQKGSCCVCSLNAQLFSFIVGPLAIMHK